ncbi:MAG: glycine cleavage system protein GcvH [Proteobacteria bacterium]|nr:glycine cleavage system protein GcvH [Pseudomonadota bacterium]MBK8961360.1 glycine cleavage system protein GcvH [Pseudomonadota bacterium]
MNDLRYSSDHVWVRLDDDGVATVGVTDYAQAELGDVIAVEAPEVERDIVVNEEIGMLEADDGNFELKAPTSGSVVEVNEAVLEKPELINESPFDDGWLFRMSVDDEEALDDLMDEEDYADYLDSLG